MTTPSENHGHTTRTAAHPYVGLWATPDGRIRQELRADGRYVEARGGRKTAYQGAYQVSGSHIAYQDDAGFTADGHFDNDTLFHAGMVLFRPHVAAGQPHIPR